MKKNSLLLILLILSPLVYGQVESVLCDTALRTYDKETGKEYYHAYVDASYMLKISDQIKREFNYKGLTRDSVQTSLGEKTNMLLFISEDGVLEKYLVGRKSWVNGCSIFEKQVLPQLKNLPFQTVQCNDKRVPYRLFLILSFSLRIIDSYFEEDNKTITIRLI